MLAFNTNLMWNICKATYAILRRKIQKEEGKKEPRQTATNDYYAHLSSDWTSPYHLTTPVDLTCRLFHHHHQNHLPHHSKFRYWVRYLFFRSFHNKLIYLSSVHLVSQAYEKVQIQFMDQLLTPTLGWVSNFQFKMSFSSYYMFVL